MKLCITAAQRKQLTDARNPTTGVVQRGGVMIVPRMLSPEDWEREATISQAQLIADARDDPRHTVVAEPEPMTAQQESDFQHHLHASRHLGKPLDERAAEAYRKALGIIR